MSRDAKDPVKPVEIETECRHCDHEIETTLRLRSSLLHGAPLRVRCAECRRPTAYRGEDTPGCDPDWFFSLEESAKVHRFTRGRNVEGDR